MTRAPVTKYPIDQVILALDPTAYIPPRSIGHSKIVCPFCDDTVASASIDWDKDSLKCFACAIRGDGIDIVMAVKEVDYRTAVKWCEAEVGESGPRVSRPAKRRRQGLF